MSTTGTAYNGLKTCTLSTPLGLITLELYYLHSPLACTNFSSLVTAGYYDGLPWHRVTQDVVQSGDPSGTGEGGLSSLNGGGGFEERNRLKHTGAGVLSYVQHPDGLYRSQFYLTLKPLPYADKSGLVFGRVKEGMEVLQRLARVECDGEKPKGKVTIEKAEGE